MRHDAAAGALMQAARGLLVFFGKRRLRRPRCLKMRLKAQAARDMHIPSNGERHKSFLGEREYEARLRACFRRQDRALFEF